MKWFEVLETRGHIENGKFGHYQVTLRVGFPLEECFLSFRGARSASPESITTGGYCVEDWSTPFFETTPACGYGFRAHRFAMPRNDEWGDHTPATCDQMSAILRLNLCIRVNGAFS